MKILLKPELEKFVADKVKAGQYADASDIVNEALDVLKEQEEFTPQHEAYLRREVLPYAPDAWFDPATIKIGYEIGFTRHFYMPPSMRTLEEIGADILALEKETEGLLDEILGGNQA